MRRDTAFGQRAYECPLFAMAQCGPEPPLVDCFHSPVSGHFANGGTSHPNVCCTAFGMRTLPR